MKNTNQKAIDALIANLDEAMALLDKIHARVDEMNVLLENGPEQAHWGHVGDAAHIVSVLRQIAGEE